MKRIITMQDLSCLGKCSLSVVLPTVSAMGVECTVLPTAVLSTHVAFPSPAVRGLDGLCREILEHWKTLEFRVDGILTGYLASPQQTELARELIRDFRQEGTFVAVDPAMADHGALYAGTDAAMVPAMAELCAQSDLAIPNLTEAALMTGLPFREQGDLEYYRALAKAMHGLGCRGVMLTGTGEDENSTGFYCSCGETEALYTLPREKRSCHGTGDLFAAVVAAGVVRGMSLVEAGRLAAQFISRVIRATPETDDSRYGVHFEKELPFLYAERTQSGEPPRANAHGDFWNPHTNKRAR